MKLYHSAGIHPSPEPTDEARQLLVAAAVLFARAGGTVSLSEWADLSSLEQEALASARYAADVERACMAGLAAQGPAQAAKVYAAVDGGDALAQLVTDAAARAAGGALRGVEVER